MLHKFPIQKDYIHSFTKLTINLHSSGFSGQSNCVKMC